MQFVVRSFLLLVLTPSLVACGAAGATGDVVSAEAPATAPAPISTGQYVLLRPSRSDGPATLLVVLPGAKLPPESYVELARTIQAATPLALWVGIARFPFNMPQPLQATGRWQAIVDRARAEGFVSDGNDHIFLAGHSLGGIFAHDVAQKKQLGGLLLWGSYLPKLPGSPRLAQYPVPTLTLGGELDGRTWITRLAEEADAEQAIAAASSEADAAATKPVVILPAVTHFQFATGEADSEDLAPELPLDEAHARIAGATRDFLVARVLDGDDPLGAQARLALGLRVLDTRALLAGYRAAQALDQGGWCEAAQRQVAGVSDALLAVDDRAYGSDVATFALSKAELSTSAAGVHAQTTSLLAYAADPFDTSTTIPKGAVALACKLKSHEAVAALLPAAAAASPASCAEINQAAFAWALEQVTPDQQARYLARGKPLRFLDDATHASGPGWLVAPLSFDRAADGSAFEVRSPRLHTALDAPLGLGGDQYCKLLAPSRAVEWILVGGFKR